MKGIGLYAIKADIFVVKIVQDKVWILSSCLKLNNIRNQTIIITSAVLPVKLAFPSPPTHFGCNRPISLSPFRYSELLFFNVGCVSWSACSFRGCVPGWFRTLDTNT